MRHIYTAMALINKSVIDKLKESGVAETTNYLADLPEGAASNVLSLNHTLRRLQDRHRNLYRSAGRFKGKKVFDSFIAEPFSYPVVDRKKQDAARFVKNYSIVIVIAIVVVIIIIIIIIVIIIIIIIACKFSLLSLSEKQRK